MKSIPYSKFFIVTVISALSLWIAGCFLLWNTKNGRLVCLSTLAIIIIGIYNTNKKLS